MIGKELASSYFTSCPKYSSAEVEKKAELIVEHKACARCTSWKHERTACLLKTDKPCRKDACTANHHTSLHGTKNSRVMNIKVCHANLNPQEPDGNPDEYGLLPMITHVFEEVNQATVIFMDEGFS